MELQLFLTDGQQWKNWCFWFKSLQQIYIKIYQKHLSRNNNFKSSFRRDFSCNL